MACIIRNNRGEVEQVTADNGSPSSLFESLQREVGDMAEEAYKASNTPLFKETVIKPKVTQHIKRIKEVLNTKRVLNVSRGRVESEKTQLDRLIEEGKITYTNEDGNLCAASGLASVGFSLGGTWALVEDLEGEPSHKLGGVDLQFGEDGVSYTDHTGQAIKAEDGLLIPGEAENPWEEYESQSEWTEYQTENTWNVYEGENTWKEYEGSGEYKAEDGLVVPKQGERLSDSECGGEGQPPCPENTVDYGTQEYRKAYEEGRIVGQTNELEEVEITADKFTGENLREEYPLYDTLTEEEKKYFRDTSTIGSSIRRKARTNRGLGEDTVDVTNKILYGTAAGMLAPYAVGAAIGTGQAVTAAGTAAAPYITAAGATAIPGLASVPGATLGNLANAGFATDFLYNRAPEIPKQIAEGNYREAAMEAGFGALDLAGLGAGNIGKISKVVKAGGDKVSSKAVDDAFKSFAKDANQQTPKPNSRNSKSLMKTSPNEDIKTQFKNAFSNPDADIVNSKSSRVHYRYDGGLPPKELEDLLNLDSMTSNLEQQASGNLKDHLKFLARDEGLDMNIYNKLIDDLDVNKLSFDTKEKLNLFFDKSTSYTDEYFSYMDSPKMQKKLKDFSNEYGVDLVKEYEKHKSVTNRNKSDMVRLDYNSPLGETGSYGVDFEMAFGKNSKLPMYESNRINLNPSLIDNGEELKKTIWHELSHSFNRKIADSPKLLKELDDIFYKDISSIPKEKTNKTWVGDFQNAKLDKAANEQITYFTQPEEVWSHLSTNLKQDLKREGLIKDFHEPITLEHLDKVQSNTITDYLPLIKDKGKLLNLINKMTLGIAPITGVGVLSQLE